MAIDPPALVSSNINLKLLQIFALVGEVGAEVGGAICAAHRDEPLTASKSAAVATERIIVIILSFWL